MKKFFSATLLAVPVLSLVLCADAAAGPKGKKTVSVSVTATTPMTPPVPVQPQAQIQVQAGPPGSQNMQVQAGPPGGTVAVRTNLPPPQMQVQVAPPPPSAVVVQGPYAGPGMGAGTVVVQHPVQGVGYGQMGSATVSVQVGGPPPPSAVVVQEYPSEAQPGYVAAPAGPGCEMMTGGRVSELVASIQAESFSSGQLRVLGDVAQGNCFTVAHVERILPLFSFEQDKVKALEIISPMLVDRQNAFRLYRLFTFDSYKEQARKVLSR